MTNTVTLTEPTVNSLMSSWTGLELWKSATQSGVYSQLVQIPYVTNQVTYSYVDAAGQLTDWYEVRRYAPGNTFGGFSPQWTVTPNRELVLTFTMPNLKRWPALTLEYLRIPAKATSLGTTVDPRGDTLQFAVMAHGATPANTDWKGGVWEVDTTTTPSTYYATLLVGPSGTVAPAAGSYDVWCKVSDNPAIPVRLLGEIVIV